MRNATKYPSSVMQLFELINLSRGIYKAVIMHERTLVVAAIDGTQGKQRRGEGCKSTACQAVL